MENKKIQDLLDNFDREEDELLGMMVFNMKTGEVLASTFDKDRTKTIIKMEQMTIDLEKNKFSQIDNAGPKTWALYSLDRKLSGVCRVRGDIFLVAEYAIQKAPTGALEDILEIALLIGNLI